MELECNICLELMNLTDDLSVLRCGHLFHTNCAVTWLEPNGATCPVCRHDTSSEAIIKLFVNAPTPASSERRSLVAELRAQIASLQEMLDGQSKISDLEQQLVDNQTLVADMRVQFEALQELLDSQSERIKDHERERVVVRAEVVQGASASRKLHQFEVAPFTPESLWRAGDVSNWDQLRSMLGPLLGQDFAVTDVTMQGFVDHVRHLLDSSADPDDGVGIVQRILLSDANGDADMLKAVLEVGADPDIPDNRLWRPLHACGSYGRIDAVAVVFPCRPDVAAENENGQTPLSAAKETECPGDEEFPARCARRPAVAKAMADYQEGGFPKIAELACLEKWFAVKNLLRRQKVPASEFQETFGGKSAVEWARIYGQHDMAKELEYYALDLGARFRQAQSIIKGLQEQLLDQENKMEQLLSDVGIAKNNQRRTDSDVGDPCDDDNEMTSRVVAAVAKPRRRRQLSSSSS